MSKKRKALTQEEIWDDSELLDSWNEAVEEYKYYHSLHARGEKIQDVLRQAEEAESNPRKAAAEPLNTTTVPGTEDMSDSEGEIHETEPSVNIEFETAEADGGAPNNQPVPPQLNAGSSIPTPALPQALMVGVRDEALKNLMMSWYYAGYYTGFYEGQQSQSQVQHDQAAQNGDLKV